MKYLLNIFIILFLFFTQYAYGQFKKLEFTKITHDDRISQSHILSIIQDNEGFIWIGTFNGIYRYDGYNFFRYNENLADDIFLLDNGVHAIFEEDSSRFWIGSKNGLHLVNRINGDIKHFIHQNEDSSSIGNNIIKSIVKTTSGEILVGTYGGGLSIYNKAQQNFTNYTHQPSDTNSLSSNLINSIYIDRDRCIWIGTEGGGINTFDLEKRVFHRLNDTLGNIIPDMTINSFIEDAEGNIWIGTWNRGAFKYNKNQKTFTEYSTQSPYPKTLSNNTVRDFAKDWDGNIWIATYGGGVNIYDSKKEIIYQVNQNVKKTTNTSEMFLWSLLHDKANNIWIGTFDSGILNYSKNKLNLTDLVAGPTLNDSIKNLTITSLIEDSKGNIWFGTLGKGVYKLDSTYTKLTQVINNPLSISNIIRSIYEDATGKIWIGTDGGLYKINSEHNKLTFYTNDISNPLSICLNGIYAIYGDTKGNIWIGLWGKGVNLLKKEDIEKSPKDAVFEKFENQNLSECNVWDIKESRDGNILLGTSKGLVAFNPTKKTVKQLSSYDVSSLFWDNEGDLWAGTFGNGVLHFNQTMENFTVFEEKNGLISNILYSFFNDSKNNLWISTDKGFTRFSPGRKIKQNFYRKKNLELTKIGLKALQKTKNDLVIVGGDGGIKVFDPNLVLEDLNSDPLFITDVKLFNESIRDMDKQFTDFPSLKELTFSYKQNFISIEFSALNYLEADKIKYAYKLEGYDHDWIYTDAANRSATYKKLEGGKYKFIVRSMNIHGMWTNNEAALIINIIPPFWETLIFRISIGIFLLYLMYVIIQFRDKKVHQNYHLKQELFKSEKLLIENVELKKQIDQFNNQIQNKKNELTTSTLQIVAKTQALSSIRAEIQGILPQAIPITKRKLEKVIYQINKNLNNKDEWERLNLNLDLIQDNFITRFAEQYPQITHKDLKVCAYIRMNISNKEIAEILNISKRSLEMCRYRIRNKINLDKQTQLNDFILRF
jgi:ligand-binding sensor domain-containing protein/DNA-binding CsgD family transcriptional regulator